MAAANDTIDWLARLKAGESEAAQRLWERYMPRLIRLAGAKLPASARRVADEDDLALSAFHSFLQGVDAGRFPRLDDRDDLWSVLVVLTHRKATAYRRRALSQKRGGGRVRGESALMPSGQDESAGGLDQIIGDEPTPEFAAMVAERFRILLSQLNDAELEGVALLKLQGYSVTEIAERIGCSKRSIERRLQIIRRTWLEAEPADDEAGP